METGKKFGIEETGLLSSRRVTHLPLWQYLDLGVGRIEVNIAIGTHTTTTRYAFVHSQTTTQNTADTNTYYYYIKRNKSSVLEHIDYYNYY